MVQTGSTELGIEGIGPAAMMLQCPQVWMKVGTSGQTDRQTIFSPPFRKVGGQLTLNLCYRCSVTPQWVSDLASHLLEVKDVILLTLIPEYFGRSWSTLWLLMSWLLTSPYHQQQ